MKTAPVNNINVAPPMNNSYIAPNILIAINGFLKSTQTKKLKIYN